MHIAIIIDAGHLLTGGSESLTGSKVLRQLIKFNPVEFKKALHELLPILDTQRYRIYWYDAAMASGQSPEQSQIESVSGFKLVLGTMNNQGIQKMVDTLLVTDLFDLTVRKEVDTVYLIAGDEDLVPGITWAQRNGAMVTLIQAGKDATVSRRLGNATDHQMVFTQEQLQKFITIEHGNASPNESSEILQTVYQKLISEITEMDVQHFFADGKIPRDVDGRLLNRGREALSRDLTAEERHKLRSMISTYLKSKPVPIDINYVTTQLLASLTKEEKHWLTLGFVNKKENVYKNWMIYFITHIFSTAVSNGDINNVLSMVKKELLKNLDFHKPLKRENAFDYLDRNLDIAAKYAKEVENHSIPLPDLVKEGLAYAKRHGCHSTTPTKQQALEHAFYNMLHKSNPS